jgi:DNA-binding NarL/FixJ family response regulator
MEEIKVIVFDDNSTRRDGLSMLINSMENMNCVATFNDCRNVEENVKSTSPDVILMDIDMPHVDGIQGLKRIRKVNPKIKVLMQTVFEDNEKIFEAICAGADGYILKQASPTKLIDAISEVLEGGAPMTPIIARKVLQLFNTKNKVVKNASFDLTKRELEILDLLVKGNSYKMIADLCHISYPTVNTHVSHIYEKLKVHSVAAAVSIAIKEGLV